MKTLSKVVFALLACVSLASANDVSVQFNLVNNGGNAWTYNYTVFNNNLSSPLVDFVIYFPDTGGSPGNYTFPITVPNVTSPTDWFGLADGSFPPPLATWTTFGTGIMKGDSLPGFGVSFEYTGTAPLGRQLFEVYDPQDLSAPVTSGWTTSASVPDGGSGWSWLVAGLGLLAFQRIARREPAFARVSKRRIN